MTKVVQIGTRLSVFLALVGLLALAAYWIGSRLSSDAIGLIIGLLFGMLASLPGALLALSARRDAREAHSDGGTRYPAPYAAPSTAPPYPPGPVIIIVEDGKARCAEQAGAEIVLWQHDGSEQ